MVVLGEEFNHEVYGLYFVDSIVNAKKVFIKFRNTGYVCHAQSDKIKKGAVKDVLHPYLYGLGYYGVKQREIKNNRKSYDAWRHMLYRCYDERAANTHPTYGDCYVCREWHNFSVFHGWYMANYKRGCELDKDIKVKGNKKYSPETCIFATPDENKKANAKTYRVVSPVGEVLIIKNMATFCKSNNLSHSDMSMVCSGKRGTHKGYTSPGRNARYII